jgi:hypothetical protein
MPAASGTEFLRAEFCARACAICGAIIARA